MQARMAEALVRWPGRWDGRAAVLASILSHLLLVGLWSLAMPRPLSPPPVIPITVDLIAAAPAPAPVASPPPEAAAPMQSPAQVTTTAPSPAAASAQAQPAPSPPRIGQEVIARELYAARLLTQPSMAQVRRTLQTLADPDRIAQLCAIEAIEQIGRAAPALAPDSVVSYAMADPSLEGFTLVAPGAGFRSRRKWYELSFRCTVRPDFAGVVAFSFRLGSAIPPSQWEDHNLIAEDADE